MEKVKKANRKIKNKAGVTALDVALDKDVQEFLKKESKVDGTS